jgi:ABC-2 type transport system ATP-binding protein
MSTATIAVGDHATGPPATTRSPAMSLRGLTKRYGERTAVDGLTIDVPAGVVAGFVGPNGAGKTTTMAMLLGLVTPTDGDGSVLGEPLCEPGAYLGRVGALIEGPAFYPALSGERNLAVLATAAGHDPAQIPRLLDLVGLGARGGDAVRRYSFGMKQRLGIASALLGDPDLLILDEPINGLDPAGVHEMRGLIGRLAGGERTVLVSSHVLAELEQVCDWLIVIDGGRLVFQGPADELLDRTGTTLVVVPEHPADAGRLRALLEAAGHEVSGDAPSPDVDAPGHAPSAAGAPSPDGDAPGHAPSAAGAPSAGGAPLLVAADGADLRGLAAAVNRAAAGQGIVLAELRVARTSLEDRYLTMVRGGDR